MIVDSSALVAILRSEPERDACLDALTTAASSGISAATLLECSIVIDSFRDPVVSRRLDELRLEAGIHVAPFTATQADVARRAYRDYGKGSGHPAGLNLGDCFAYALATEQDEPLLFVGDDFTHTDVRSALDQPSR